MHEELHSILETDASLARWRAKREETKTQGVWYRSKKGQHMNCQELLSVRWIIVSL